MSIFGTFNINYIILLLLFVNILYLFINMQFIINLIIFIINIILITMLLYKQNLFLLSFCLFMIYIGGIIIYILILTFSLSENNMFNSFGNNNIKIRNINISYEILFLQSLILWFFIFFQNQIDMFNDFTEKIMNIIPNFNYFINCMTTDNISNIIFIEHVELFILTGLYIFIITIILINNFIK